MLTASQIAARIALRERRLSDIRNSMQAQAEYILELLQVYTESTITIDENGVSSLALNGMPTGYSVYSLAFAEWLRLFVESEGLGREIDQLDSLLP